MLSLIILDTSLEVKNIICNKRDRTKRMRHDSISFRLQQKESSMTFLPRDARSASAVLLSYVVRPSVCLSV